MASSCIHNALCLMSFTNAAHHTSSSSSSSSSLNYLPEHGQLRNVNTMHKWRWTRRPMVLTPRIKNIETNQINTLLWVICYFCSLVNFTAAEPGKCRLELPFACSVRWPGSQSHRHKTLFRSRAFYLCLWTNCLELSVVCTTSCTGWFTYTQPLSNRHLKSVLFKLAFNGRSR